jgi:glycosyltransferase involved in cell wall biosynthesis
MRLSFIIPAYNEEEYLSPCIESILRQTREHKVAAEIIVVNNASTDRTRAIALSFPEVTVVDEPSKGLTHARQAGFMASTGELIANVDADSRLTNRWLAQVLDAFACSPEMVALSGPVVYYDLPPASALLVKGFYAIAWVTYLFNRFVLRVGSMIQGGNFVVTRRALEQIGGYDLSIAFYGEDTDIARRLNKAGEVRFTLALKMFSSARRLKKEGIVTTAIQYSLNYIWTTFLKRPFSDDYADVREVLEKKTVSSTLHFLREQ